ncbi:MAG: hypothetical protein WCQ57_12175, partial [Verrucomicrobiota bacterium]
MTAYQMVDAKVSASGGALSTTAANRSTGIMEIVFIGILLSVLSAAGGSSDDRTLCPRLAAFDAAKWEEIERAFGDAPVWKMDQAWRDKRERRFRAGKVRIGWRDDRLLCFADLSDRDLITKALKRNEPIWSLGDALEVFAGVNGHPSYIEYHTAPNGVVLQLFWPDSSALKRASEPGGLARFTRIENGTLTKVRPVRSGYQVYMAIPASAVWGRKPPKGTLAGQVWDLSFGRYDYTSNEVAHVVSSTSPLTQTALHRRHEWRR